MDPAQTCTLGLPLTLAAAVALPVIRNYIRSWVTALLVEIGRCSDPFHVRHIGAGCPLPMRSGGMKRVRAVRTG
jgi:hypothetical protein